MTSRVGVQPAGEVEPALGCRQERNVPDQLRAGDIERLATVNAAGSLLGFFRVGTCVFCGAEPEHRHPGHSTQETTQLHDAVQAESAKTTTLLTELLPTITDLSTQFDELRNNREALLRQADRLDADITTAEDQLSPLRTHMDELLAARSAVERELELHSRINEMQERRSKLDSEGAVKVARPAEHIPTRVLNAL